MAEHRIPRKYTRLATLGQGLSLLLLAGIPLFLLGQLVVQGPETYLEFIPGAEAAYPPGPPRSALFAAIGLGALPIAASLWALWHISCLFACFRSGHILTIVATRHVRRIGQALLLQAVAALLTVPPITMLMTLHNPEGHRQVAVGVGSNELWLVVSGVLLIVIGAAFSQAVEIDQENRGFV
ncbi:DUF2975 domain-containing protein [Aliiroseovarius marinus]|uniref:DUF2975 domain-containing protein n=1 Tax=Aliiroseovarius marinus TaxID=2500159 RepID=UPI003D7E5FC0